MICMQFFLLSMDFHPVFEDRCSAKKRDAAAVELTGLIGMVRGYGPVKMEAMTRYHEKVGALQQAFREVPAMAAS